MLLYLIILSIEGQQWRLARSNVKNTAFFLNRLFSPDVNDSKTLVNRSCCTVSQLKPNLLSQVLANGKYMIYYIIATTQHSWHAPRVRCSRCTFGSSLMTSFPTSSAFIYIKFSYAFHNSFSEPLDVQDQLVTKTNPRLRRINSWLLCFNEWSGKVYKERKQTSVKKGQPIELNWANFGSHKSHIIASTGSWEHTVNDNSHILNWNDMRPSWELCYAQNIALLTLLNSFAQQTLNYSEI